MSVESQSEISNGADRCDEKVSLNKGTRAE